LPNKPSRTTFHHRLNEMISILRNDIQSGILQSGQFLPSIAELGKQYQLSINSVQKGLNQLEEEALIERLPRIGIKVKGAAIREETTISLGFYPSLLKDLELQAIIDNFHADYPHITVQLVPLQYENYNDTTEYYLKNELIDVITINHINFLNFRDETSLLSELFEPLADQPGIQPYLKETFTEDETRYALPIAFSPVILCYNKQMLEQSALPLPSADWTWQQFMVYLDLIDKHNDTQMSFYFYPANYNRWPIFLLQSGSPLSLSSIVEGMQACYELIHRNKRQLMLLSDDDFNVEEMFAEQKISIMMTTYFNLNKLRGENGMSFELAPLPYVHIPKTMLLSIGLAMNKRSRHKQAAMDFTNYVLSYPSQLLVRKRTYSIPALQAAADWQGEESIYRPASFHIYNELSDTYADMAELGCNRREKEAMLSVMKMYWADMINKEEAVARLSAILPSSGR